MEVGWGTYTELWGALSGGGVGWWQIQNYVYGVGGWYLHDLPSHKKTPCQVCHSVVRADPQVGMGGWGHIKNCW